MLRYVINSDLFKEIFKSGKWGVTWGFSWSNVMIKPIISTLRTLDIVMNYFVSFWISFAYFLYIKYTFLEVIHFYGNVFIQPLLFKKSSLSLLVRSNNNKMRVFC